MKRGLLFVGPGQTRSHRWEQSDVVLYSSCSRSLVRQVMPCRARARSILMFAHDEPGKGPGYRAFDTPLSRYRTLDIGLSALIDASTRLCRYSPMALTTLGKLPNRAS